VINWLKLNEIGMGTHNQNDPGTKLCYSSQQKAGGAKKKFSDPERSS
jgi:hypothetical protein